MRSQPRRRFPWARILLVLIIAAIAAYFVLPRYVETSADGLVAGDLVPIAPIFQAKIDRMLVGCSQVVHAGQPLAVVSNFLLEEQYSQERHRLLDEAALAVVGETEGVEQAETEIADAEAKYGSAVADEAKTKTLYDAYERSYRDGAVASVDAVTARESWEEAVATAIGYKTLIDAGREHLIRLKESTAAKASELRAEAGQEADVQQSVHAQTLRSPIDGRIVDCAGRPGEIVDAEKPLYHIFGTRRAYVLAYFSPDESRTLSVGQTTQVAMDGFPFRPSGRIVALYPTLTHLPTELTKFFWQHEQWSEYRPVKVAFTSLDPQLRDQLVYDAQSKVSIVRHRFAWGWLNSALHVSP